MESEVEIKALSSTETELANTIHDSSRYQLRLLTEGAPNKTVTPKVKMEASMVNSVIDVAAISGSLHKASYNRSLLRAAIKISSESIQGMKINYIDVSSLPMINTDLKVDGTYPPVVEAFRQKILEADSVLFASPEYNYSVAPPLKNAIDWADKPAAIVSAGGGFGGGRAQYHLRQIGVYLDLHFINKPEFFLNAFQPPAKFDSEGNLIDPDAEERIKEVLLALQAFTLRLKGKC